MEFDASYMAMFQQMAQTIQGQGVSPFPAGYFPGFIDPVQADPEGQPYFQEAIKNQLAAALRHAQMLNKSVADYASIMDPANIELGPSVQVENLEQVFSWLKEGEEKSFTSQTQIDLDFFQMLISDGDNPETENVERRLISLINPLTESGMLITKNKIHTVVEGEITATQSFQGLFKIGEDGATTGTINLPNGVKLTFGFELHEDGSKPTLQRVFISHPDGSYAEVANIENPSEELDIQSGQQDPSLVEYMDLSTVDGYSLFMGPEGASLHYLDPESGSFTGVFGDERALNLGLQAASFGGNLYNFYWAEGDGWQANLAVPHPSNDETPFPPGFPPGIPIDGSMFPPGFSPPILPGNFPPGFVPPPSFWNEYKPVGVDSIEDLIFEDLTGYDPSGTLEQAKKKFLRHQLKYGKLDFETKLFILLYLFLDDNSKKTDEIFQKLAGVDSDSIGEPETGPKKMWTPETIQFAPIKEQIEFWSNFLPPNLSTDPMTKQQQLQQNATFVNGQIKGLEVDQSLLQARLTNLIRDRQRFVDTINNAMKALDDALHNAVRRIV